MGTHLLVGLTININNVILNILLWPLHFLRLYFKLPVTIEMDRCFNEVVNELCYR